MTRFLASLVLALVVGLPGRPAAAETLAVVAHIHTPLSDGEHPPDELARMLAGQGIDAGIITDHDRLEVQWGLPPFRNLLSYTYRRSSIATEGVDRYARSIREAGALTPGLILIPAVESNPYYRIDLDWSERRFRVYNLHEHVLAIGIADEELTAVPSIANGFHAPPALRGLAVGLGLAAVGVAAVLLRPRDRRRRDLRFFRAPAPSRPWLLAGFVLVGGLALADSLTLSASRIHQYAPDAGALPYQIFIDWVADRGGVTFWSHPGVNEVLRKGPVEVITRPYFHHLFETRGYTGLEGFGRPMTGPEGIWDRLLAEHCAGAREHPPWFLAQADFKTGSAALLAARVNHVSVDERSERGVIAGLRAGSFYATNSSLGRRWRLDEFRVSDGSGSAGSGGLLRAGAPVTVVARFRRLVAGAPPLEVELIRQGETVLAKHVADSEEIRFLDAAPGAGEKRYYRLIAGKPSRVQLVANPIFVTGRES